MRGGKEGDLLRVAERGRKKMRRRCMASPEILCREREGNNDADDNQRANTQLNERECKQTPSLHTGNRRRLGGKNPNRAITPSLSLLVPIVLVPAALDRRGDGRI